MATTNKIMVGIDDQVIELTGKSKEDFIADREESNARILTLEAEAEAKKQARIDAITKLGQASGLTTEEIESILNI
jgi:Fic family protein